MLWDTKKKLQVDLLVGKETTEAIYYEMMECLPPVALACNAYLVGEPKDYKNGLPRYELFFKKGEKFFCGGLETEIKFKTWLVPA